ncbi:tetratricopeptide (TPR) repeat protein [Rhodobacteraceae bacterium MBR-64]
MNIARRLSLAAAILSTALTAAAPLVAQDGLAGAYLAARVAAHANDYRAAADYFSAAVVRDPDNAALLEYAITAQVGLGNFDAAGPLADRMGSLKTDSQVAAIVRLVRHLKAGDYAAANAGLAEDKLVGQLVDRLVNAWVEVALGRFSQARTAFDAITANDDTRAFGLYHSALALASVGDFEAADAIFSGTASGPVPLTRRGVIAHVEILSQLDRNQDAIALIEETFGTTSNPEFAALAERLKAGEVLAFDLVKSPTDGLAEVFYTVAGVLRGEAADAFTLIFARSAEYLRPDDVDQMLLTASILESQGQYDLATAAYQRVPPVDPSFHVAEIGRATALARAGKTEAAIEVLQQLGRTHGDLPSVQVALGDRLRSEERYAEAAAAYGRAIDLLGDPKPGQWPIYYSRGISHERIGDWDKAEADFREALTLQPDQPEVLNYLGYSYVDKGQNLDEALDMIKRAVAARPDDGYITDSLGWAYYKMGRYQEAVAPMEKAAQLEAVDPIVNDHLGDVYWAVGRTLEARFQWRRALSFGPEEKDAQRIRRKLEVGLDQVLKEEGAPPLREANAAAADK